MRWPLYAAVRFRSNDFEADVAARGAKGYIIRVYDDGYEVEVSDPVTAETLSLEPVPDAQLDLLDEP